MIRCHCLRLHNSINPLQAFLHKAVRGCRDIGQLLNTVFIFFLRRADRLDFVGKIGHFRNSGDLFFGFFHRPQGSLGLVLGQCQFILAETSGHTALFKGIDLHRHFYKSLRGTLNGTLQFIQCIRLIRLRPLVQNSLCLIQDGLQLPVRICDPRRRFIIGRYGFVIFLHRCIKGAHGVPRRLFCVPDSV